MFVPGATIPGERYLPLMEAVQALYPGALWVAATTDWNNDRWGAGRAANEPSRSFKITDFTFKSLCFNSRILQPGEGTNWVFFVIVPLANLGFQL